MTQFRIINCSRKLTGQKKVTNPPRVMERTPCVGMCYRTGSNGDDFAEWRKQRRARKKPCIGLCYIARNKTTSTVTPEIEDKYGEAAPDE